MFTGIIESVGTVRSVEDLGGGKRFRIRCDFGNELQVDESVAVNGVCLTVVEQRDNWFDAVAIEETLAKSSLGHLAEHSIVNLERAMAMNARLDGHIVQGHVDTTGIVKEVNKLGSSHEFTIAINGDDRKYLIPKGSVALDGISLTVASVDTHEFMVAIIPHTFDNTNVSEWSVGKAVNIEFDMIGKYVVGYLENTSAELKSSPISREWLAQKGF